MASSNLSFQSGHAYQRIELSSWRQVNINSNGTNSNRETQSEEASADAPRSRSAIIAEQIQARFGQRFVQQQETTSSSISREVKPDDSESEDELSHVEERFRKVITLLERVFGVEISVADNSKLGQGGESSGADISAPPQNQASNRNANAPENRQAVVAMQQYHQITEREASSVSIQGRLELNDGRKLDVDFNLDMSRMQQEEYWGEIVISGGKNVDPLVVNLNGNSAQLTNQRTSFDIDGDGEEDQVAFATGDSAFLALDKNNNGTIDDGNELFGPNSGSGFSDLASYDDNGDGFIDSLDSIWQELKLVQRDEQGNESIMSLADVGISAFVLERTSSQFGIFNDQGEQTGAIRETGIYVRDDGSVDSMQHVDLVV